MPVRPTYPGVYIEEVPSGVRTIAGVSTSVTAFVGYLKRGPLDKAVQIFNFGDFEREFGGMDPKSEISYAVQQFFLNGGTEAWVVRTAADNPPTNALQTAQVTLQDATSTDVLVVAAANEGTWGNNIRLDVDYDTTDPNGLFNLTVTEYVDNNGEQSIHAIEIYRNLSMGPDSPACALDVVNEASKLVKLSFPLGSTPILPLPAQTGSVGTITLTDSVLGSLVASHVVTVTVNGVSVNPVSGDFSLGDITGITTLPILGRTLQSKLRTISGLEKATVELINNRLRVLPGNDNPNATISFSDNNPGTLAGTLGLDNAFTNVQQYWLGKGAQDGAQTGAVPGTDGEPPGADELRGVQNNKTGLYALEDVDIFNILCIPRTAELDKADANAVLTEALAYCEEQRAFMIIDIPEAKNEVQEIKDWLDENPDLRRKNAALYFPRVQIADQKNGYRLRSVGYSGTIAGLIARTDSNRGVWKAPAGTDAVLRGVQALDYKLTDPENGTLNPLAINCLRNFPIYGNVCWGARTLKGADQQASEWKYLPVRRLALFIEESLYRGTQWVVFEPNDEPLWAQIRLNVGAFMHNLFRQGAFQGSTPQKAYFVRCDSETTTQNDIDQGIVNILVGFAPLKPAEFVIIKISQIAGEIKT